MRTEANSSISLVSPRIKWQAAGEPLFPVLVGGSLKLRP